ncbi:hypothetical protein [Sinomonas sp. P10A9]|uniref:Uncharacterized protein n=1 Tax=Sinomonas puerhi TaxID=3238584 RepID=A0AB39L1F3_9MICC
MSIEEGRALWERLHGHAEEEQHDADEGEQLTGIEAGRAMYAELHPRRDSGSATDGVGVGHL